MASALRMSRDRSAFQSSIWVTRGVGQLGDGVERGDGGVGIDDLL